MENPEYPEPKQKRERCTRCGNLRLTRYYFYLWDLKADDYAECKLKLCKLCGEGLRRTMKKKLPWPKAKGVL